MARRARCRPVRLGNADGYDGGGDGHRSDSQDEPDDAGAPPELLRVRFARPAHRVRAHRTRSDRRRPFRGLRPADPGLRPADPGLRPADPGLRGRRGLRGLVPGFMLLASSLFAGGRPDGRGWPAVALRAQPRGITRLAGKQPQRRTQFLGELATGRVTVCWVLRQRRGQHQVRLPRADQGAAPQPQAVARTAVRTSLSGPGPARTAACRTAARTRRRPASTGPRVRRGRGP